MKILDSVCVISEDDNETKRYYYYRLTETLLKNKVAYGIEVERQDFKGSNINNIERECLPIISQKIQSVQALLKLLSKNIVSPIHVVDIIGEEIDELAYNFN